MRHHAVCKNFISEINSIRKCEKYLFNWTREKRYIKEKIHQDCCRHTHEKTFWNQQVLEKSCIKSKPLEVAMSHYIACVSNTEVRSLFADLRSSRTEFVLFLLKNTRE